MVNTLVMLLVVGIIIGMIWWLCDYMPVPEPMNKLIKIVSMVVGVIAIIYALLGLAGMAPPLAIG